MPDYYQWLNKIPDSFKYEPTHEIKKQWTKVRHNKKRLGDGIELEGLFSCDDFARDYGFLWVALVIEFIGFVILFQLFTSPGLLVVLFVFGMIIFDFFFAFMAHYWQDDECTAKNELKLAGEQIQIVQWENKLKKARRLKVFFSLLIIGVLVLKIWGMYYAKGYLFEEDLYVYIGLYFIVAVIHIFCTGFAISGFNLRRKLKKEFKNYQNPGPTAANVQRQALNFAESEFIFSNKQNEYIVGAHKVSWDGVAQMNFLESYGILFDNELQAFLDNVVQGEKNKLFQALLDAQLHSILTRGVV